MGEVFDAPFGKCLPEHLKGGYGSKQCHVYFQNNQLYLNSKNGQKKQKKDPFALALADIIAFVCDEDKCSEGVLAVLGYERREKRVVCSLNGRPFDATDAEHFMCKLYFQVKFTLNSYRKSFQPAASRVYCWPQKFHDSKLKVNVELKQAMLKAVATFQRLSERHSGPEEFLLSLPDILVIPNEMVLPRENNDASGRSAVVGEDEGPLPVGV